jgi:uncharacterized protein YpuA (DUF1002 family)
MKKKWIAILMSAICLTAAIPGTVVLADGQKVVTLGADLSDAQKEAVLRYFGVYGQDILTLTITNQDERDHLGAYVPLEQIGTHTYSCALVSPTTSGGIQVKTANLTWVTSNMIASTLSTSGVVNCDVLAAAPFEVSGTGALTGILMAYESASGTTLDDTKKELATQELITTTTIADSIGQQEATSIVNESKIQVIQGNVVDGPEIGTIIDEVAEEQNVTLSDEDRQLIEDLLTQISQQEYDYEEMKDTLERVESNMQDLADQVQSGDTQVEGAQTIDDVTVVPDTGSDVVVDADGTDIDIYDADVIEQPEPETLSADSILMNTDDSALGDAVVIDATNQSALSEDTQTEADVYETEIQTEGFSITVSDSYEGQDDTVTDVPVIDDANTFVEETEAPAQTELYVETEAPAVDDTSSNSAIEDVPSIDTDNVFEEDNSSDQPADDSWQAETEAVIDDSITEIETEAVVSDDIIEIETEAAMESEAISLSDLSFAPSTSDENGYEVQPAGTNELTIRFQRTDLTAGSGTLTVFDAADSSLYDTITMEDTSRVSIEPLSYDELEELGWTEGSKAVITLNQPLAADSCYFIILSEDALMSEDGTSHSEATQDSLSWMIQTSTNGFTIQKDGAALYAGTTVSGYFTMDTEMGVTYAAIGNVDTSIASFSQYEYSESADFTLELLQAGSTTFQVNYFDGDGNIVDTFDYTLTIK